MSWAAEDSTYSANSLLPDQAATSQDRSLLTWLLTWPEKEKKARRGGRRGDGGGAAGERSPGLHRKQHHGRLAAVADRERLYYTQAIGGDPTHNSHDLPELLVRYGVAERLELRVAWDEGMVFERFSGSALPAALVTANGSTDVEFGFKYALTKQDNWRPQTAVIVAVTAPVGSPAQSSGQVDVRLNYLYSWELTKKLSLTCSTGSLWTAESGDRFSQFSQSASVEYELTEKLHATTSGLPCFRRDSSDDRPQHYYDGGLDLSGYAELPVGLAGRSGPERRGGRLLHRLRADDPPIKAGSAVRVSRKKGAVLPHIPAPASGCSLLVGQFWAEIVEIFRRDWRRPGRWGRMPEKQFPLEILTELPSALTPCPSPDQASLGARRGELC